MSKLSKTQKRAGAGSAALLAIAAISFLPAVGWAAVNIGQPMDKKDTYKFNKNSILTKIAIIECYEKHTKIKDGDTIKHQSHVACGEDGARFLLQQVVPLQVGQVATAHAEKNLKVFTMEPNVELVQGQYSLKIAPKAHEFLSKTQAEVYVAEWSEQSITLSIYVQVEDTQQVNQMGRTSEGAVYTNPYPFPRRRLMVTEAALAPGEEEVFSGDVWVSQPEGEDILKRMPVDARLWVEIKALQPEETDYRALGK